MTYKTILAVIQGEEEAPKLISDAIALARSLDAHLIGYHSEPLPTAYVSAVGFPDAEFIRTATELGVERSKRIAAEFGKKTREAGISTEWGSPDTDFSNELTLAHAVDLIVASQPANVGSDDDLADVDNLLYSAGRPVLVLPRNEPFDAEFKRIVIGWSRTRESARAVFDALPLLERAESVELLVVNQDTDGREVGSAMRETLKRHGVPITLSHQTVEHISVEEALANRVAATDADLLVLGAYGHSWLKQFLFGGVTRNILKNSRVATMMSH